MPQRRQPGVFIGAETLESSVRMIRIVVLSPRLDRGARVLHRLKPVYARDVADGRPDPDGNRRIDPGCAAESLRVCHDRLLVGARATMASAAAVKPPASSSDRPSRAAARRCVSSSRSC